VRQLTISAPKWQEKTSNREVWSLSLRTITPLFGGSATVREVDADYPIRAASVRGHLRFWWRATAGAKSTDPKALYAAESELWGNDKTFVTVRVEITDKGKVASLRDYLPERPSPRQGSQAGYFVFPFNSDKENPIADGRKDVGFMLHVRFNEATDRTEEVRKAIQAWLLFGGVGARTRRGCGSLRCDVKGWLPASDTDRDYFAALLNPAGTSPEHPVLAGGWLLLGETHKDAEACWRYLGTFWARFRKGHFTEKRPEYEPMSGGEWRDHNTLKNSRDNAIALAKPYLGLPIIYQKFQGSFDGTLEAIDSGRMASPIILKPVAFSDGTIRPMIACLSASAPEAIRVKSRVVALSVPQNEPVLQALGARDPLTAVRRAATRMGFKEVKL
jgi:CRISPR-associated protein Cmr1